MEKIVINGDLYYCKDGTDSKITNLLEDANKKSNRDHEICIAYDEYNQFIQNIIDTKKKTFLNGIYSTNY